jgi:very-short-patch-repair endonuclease/DNA polymerase III delta prime subunit
MTLTEQLQKLATQQLDLTARNPFLKIKKKQNVEVINEHPYHLIALLREKTLTCRVAEDVYPKESLQVLLESTESHTYADKFLDCLVLDKQESDTAEKLDVTALLDKNLNKLKLKHKEVGEEKGIHTLHLLLGSVSFQIDKKDFHAPLCLFPVLLEKDSKGLYQVSGEDQSPKENLALWYLLEKQWGIQLPVLDSDTDYTFEKVQTWLLACCQLLEQRSDLITFILNTDCYLANLDTQKQVMLLEILTLAESEFFLNNQIVQALFNPEGTPATTNNDAEECTHEGLPTNWADELSLSPVLPCDPSQQKVVHTALTGKNLVVEGPPGTGKSQTITNLIAEFMKQGKSVLFVSEKQTALDVVYSRLQKTELSDFCLDLHSPKTTLKTVLPKVQNLINHSLEKTFSLGQSSFSLSQYQTVKTELETYRTFLNTVEPRTEWTLYKLLSQCYGFKKKGTPLLLEDINHLAITANLSELSPLGLESIERQAEKWAKLKSDITVTCWNRVTNTTLPSIPFTQVTQCLNNTMADLAECLTLLEDVATLLGYQAPSNFAEIGVLETAFPLFTNSPQTSPALLQSPLWDKLPESIAGLLNKGDAYAQLKNELDAYFTVFPEEDALPELLTLCQKILVFPALLHWCLPSYYMLKKQLLPYVTQAQLLSNSQSIYNHLKVLDKLYTLQVEIENHPEGVQFANHWRGYSSNWQQLREYANWMVEVRRCLIDEKVTETAIQLASEGLNPSIQKEVTVSFERLNTLRSHIQKNLKTLETLLVSTEPLFVLQTNQALAPYLQQLKTLQENLPVLQRVVTYNAHRAECETTFPALSIFYQSFSRLDPSHLFADSVLFTLYSLLWNEVEAEHPFLTTLPIGELMRQLEQFRVLDSPRGIYKHNQIQIRRMLQHNLQRITDATANAEALKWFKRKRGLGSVRNYVGKHINALIQLKPCWMMSPLSVSTYLPTQLLFDVVIFDEASQVKPCDALATIARGKQLILVGDPKQLPPTDFFASKTEDDENDSDVVEESILDQGLRCFHCEGVKWHYRSQHESLITFSNKAFYDESLIFFPSNKSISPNLGLSFHYIDGATYTQGRKEAHPNLLEAEAVINAVATHLKTYPDETVGMATLNDRQETSLRLLWENRLQEEPELRELEQRKPEQDRLFIKKLESVQGDERDAIFVSFVFGKTHEGKFSMNFGPLNGQAGARRLNVLATRAKRSMHLFCSFLPQELRSNGNEKIELLKTWLAFAQDGKPVSTTQITDYLQFDSPFEEDVYTVLDKQGYIVKNQVGQAGFKIDLAIQDANDSSQFILGIECDGATYHSSPNQRAADSIRQEVLEGLGWKIYRIWSTDWFNDRENEIQKLLSIVQSLHKASVTLSLVP